MDFSQRSWNIDITTRCTLSCSECARTDRLDQGKELPKVDINLEQFRKLVNFVGDNRVHFCGTWGDPVWNPDFIEMLKACKEKNIKTVISNADSHRPESWYKEAFLANTDAEWWFGIDGLPYESHIYRKNQDGKKLFNIMLLANSMGINAVWQYIIFNYNKGHIKKANKIAKKHNLKIMFIDTNRNRTMQHAKVIS